MPENEPEKNLKIQPPFTTSFARPLRTSRPLRLNTCVSSAISTFPPTTPRHFQHSKAPPQKPPPFQLFRFVSFCSAKNFYRPSCHDTRASLRSGFSVDS